jgi:hypothetical protein
MKSQLGPPMRLGNAAAARVRLIMWCKACGRQVEPGAAQVAERRGPILPSSIGASGSLLPVRQPRRRHRGDRDRAAIALTGRRI